MQAAFPPLLTTVVMGGAFGVRGEGESIMSNRIQSLALVMLGAPVMVLAEGDCTAYGASVPPQGMGVLGGGA